MTAVHLARAGQVGHTPSVAFQQLPPRKDVVNQCLEFEVGHRIHSSLRNTWPGRHSGIT